VVDLRCFDGFSAGILDVQRCFCLGSRFIPLAMLVLVMRKWFFVVLPYRETGNANRVRVKSVTERFRVKLVASWTPQWTGSFRLSLDRASSFTICSVMVIYTRTFEGC